MRFWIGGLLALAWVGPALAGDKVETGPVPAWVRPVALPATPEKRDGKVTYLLADEQFRLEPGKISSYAETVFRIESAEGLDSGNISLPWQPESQTLTVHRFTITRGGRLIDILGSGRKFEILRREANLESGMLDGMLTANIQPEDLQIGDVITLATTVTSSDPTYQGHVEETANAVYDMPIGRHHFSAEWPAALPMRLRQTSGLPPLKYRQDGDTTRIELTTDGLQPPVITSGAPARFRRPRLVELSDFADWSQLAALFVPLYDQATRIPADSPLQAEVARIRAASSDPKAQAEASLALVQNRIRYVALLMGTGNFVPADATSTWARRFGDCKAKSALLVALLRALGIAADPVIVNTSGNDGLDQRLPMIGLFNHVIVRAMIGGRTYWLDGTRTGDLRLDQIATPDMDWGLPLTRGSALVRMLPEQLDQPSQETVLRIDASKGISIPAPVHAETIVRGDGAYASQVSSADLTGEARERYARDYWKQRYGFIEVDAVSMSYDAGKREMRFMMDGKAKMDWSGGVYWLVNSSLGDRDADFERGPGEDRNAPFGVTFPYFRRSTETILLPPGIVPDRDDVTEIAAGVEYRRKTGLSGNVFTVETSTRSLASEFPAAQAAEAQRTLRALAGRHLALRTGEDHETTAEEDEYRLANPPETAQQWTERGAMLMDRERYAEAVSALDKALSIEPGDGFAIALRGMSYTELEKYDAAARDFDAAEAVDPNTRPLARGRARLAELLGKDQDAVRHYSRAIEQAPDDYDLLGRRAQVYARLRDYPAMLRDSAAALRKIPEWERLYTLRARAFEAMGDRDQAAAQAVALVAARPDSITAQQAAATIFHRLGRFADAIRSATRAIEIKPSAEAYVERAYWRRWSDLDGRSADVEQALRLDPRDDGALRAKIDLQLLAKDYAAALATVAVAMKAKPADSDLLATKGQIQFLAGRKADAARDFAAARRGAKTADDFHSICWAKALAGAELVGALADCDRAIKEAPHAPEPFDSRAFALLKLGRFDEALGYYDRALAIDAALPDSLFGRALAKSGKGDLAAAAADRAAALALDPDVEDFFRFHGLAGSTLLAQVPPVVVVAAASKHREAENREPGQRPLDGFTLRGFDLLAEMDFDGALAAFETALKRDRANARALAGRGFVLAWRDDLEGAARDLEAAAVFEPDDGYVLRTRGYLAQKRQRYAEALRFYARALERAGEDHTTYGWRAEVYRLVGDNAAALRDAETATKLQPTWADMYFLRARIYQKTGQAAKAFAEARAAVAAAPQDSYAHYQAAIIYNEGGRQEEALKAINRAIEIEPRADLFLGRMLMRADGDLASKREDVEAALRFDPSNQRALEEKAALQELGDDPVGAVATLSAALRAKPNDSRLQSQRGQLLWQARQIGDAKRDFAAARAAIKDDGDLGMLCWNFAATDIDLPAALDDCQKALARTPDSGMTLISLAQVQSNMGRIDEAILSYDRALAIYPGDALALYGRAIAWKRKGDGDKSAIDRAAALKADPTIADKARRNGLTM